ncbi:MAG: hypothetical protein Q9171_000139 [Xanthocarpia ochracea]
MAELGSLSVEFTRLAQITKETKYYDAIARITDEFEKWQNNTEIPGLWPRQVDASGCKKPASVYTSPMTFSAQKGASFANEQYPQIPSPNDGAIPEGKIGMGASNVGRSLRTDSDVSTTKNGGGIERRQESDYSDSSTESLKPKPDCVAQGLSSPPGGGPEDFTIAGQADSTYEYLPKEYMLLGGLEKKYQTMYEMAAEAIKKHLLFRPMIEDEKRNLLVAAQLSTSGNHNPPRDPKMKPEQSHLGCFAGGMFAIGAKIFGRKDDLDIAKRLTDACVWSYEMTPTGIMPEHFMVVPCNDMETCPFNETLWYEQLDPYHPRARSRASISQATLPNNDKESSEQAGGKTSNSVINGTDPPATKKTALDKRQLGDIENDELIQTGKENDSEELDDRASDPSVSMGSGGSKEEDDEVSEKTAEAANETASNLDSKDSPTPTTAEDQAAEPVLPVVEAYTPPPIPSQEEYAHSRIRDEKLPKGVTRITGSKYILRPEAIESVFIMYRVTGDDYWREKGWEMFTSIQNYTRAEFGAAAISDVMSENPYPVDEMESFWLAETLKYCYLLFSEPDFYSLDDYVLYDFLSTSELDDIVAAQCQSHGLIDDALRSYFTFISNYKGMDGPRNKAKLEHVLMVILGDYLHTEYDIARCSLKLLESALFSAHRDYVRRQVIHSLLEEDSPDTLHLIVALLLFDGRDNEATFEMMNEEGVFLRLVGLIYKRKDDDAGLHRMLLELLYEMSRIQRLRIQDLSAYWRCPPTASANWKPRLVLIEDDFIRYLFEVIEGLSDDVNDPYHYPIIRVLLILNEQYMVSAHDPGPDQPPTTNLTNKVIKVLSTHGPAFKTFGENIILLLNRESRSAIHFYAGNAQTNRIFLPTGETSLQLLILKLLYLLFTTPPTYEYFYTNDLRVLVDVVIRNLLDLPLSASPLRHTYLRVLYPLLAHTQLKHPPHYKKDELLRLLTMMTSTGGIMEHHFGAVDETTKRLVGRCVRVPWLKDNDHAPEPAEEERRRDTKVATTTRKLLGAEIPGGMASSLSVVEVTTQKERPGVRIGGSSRQRHEDQETHDPLREKMSQTSYDDADNHEEGVRGECLEPGVATNIQEKSPFEVEGEA